MIKKPLQTPNVFWMCIKEEIKELKGAAIKEHRSGKNRNYEVVLQTIENVLSGKKA